jgi:hypothetical protein
VQGSVGLTRGKSVIIVVCSRFEFASADLDTGWDNYSVLADEMDPRGRTNEIALSLRVLNSLYATFFFGGGGGI